MEVTKLVWEPHNVTKCARHGIRPVEVEEVVARDDWMPIANGGHPDQARIIGPTFRDRLLTVVLEVTEEPGVWRPVTGWDASTMEVAYYREEGQ